MCGELGRHLHANQTIKILTTTDNIPGFIQQTAKLNYILNIPLDI